MNEEQRRAKRFMEKIQERQGSCQHVSEVESHQGGANLVLNGSKDRTNKWKSREGLE